MTLDLNQTVVALSRNSHSPSSHPPRSFHFLLKGKKESVCVCVCGVCEGVCVHVRVRKCVWEVERVSRPFVQRLSALISFSYLLHECEEALNKSAQALFVLRKPRVNRFVWLYPIIRVHSKISRQQGFQRKIDTEGEKESIKERKRHFRGRGKCFEGLSMCMEGHY